MRLLSVSSQARSFGGMCLFFELVRTGTDSFVCRAVSSPYFTLASKASLGAGTQYCTHRQFILQLAASVLSCMQLSGGNNRDTARLLYLTNLWPCQSLWKNLKPVCLGYALRLSGIPLFPSSYPLPVRNMESLASELERLQISPNSLGSQLPKYSRGIIPFDSHTPSSTTAPLIEAHLGKAQLWQ